MKHDAKADRALAITKARGKMYEYRVPDDLHIRIPDDLVVEKLFPLAIGSIGDYSAQIVSDYIGWRNEYRSDELDVRFAAVVLNAYVDSRLNEAPTPELLLLSSAAYYLADMPGNSAVERRNFERGVPVQAVELVALEWVLGAPWVQAVPDSLDTQISLVCNALQRHYASSDEADLRQSISELRERAYRGGDDRELLFTDILCAVAITRIQNSARTLLPQFSGIPASSWEDYLGKSSGLKEFWPSQRLLGSVGVFAGSSSVVQLPTSAGKTKAIELVLRSAMLSRRSNISVVVAPFRALCEEIAQTLRAAFFGENVDINYVSDVLAPDDLSEDVALDDIEVAPRVVVVTPEKLVYLLRGDPGFVADVGLLIFDEGHQFDSGSRGIVYELLITSIKATLSGGAQILLVSAVIQNAFALAEWLMGDQGALLTDTRLQTFRNVAFASWSGPFGRLQFRDSPGAQLSYFVPRVIQPEPLNSRMRGGRVQMFPSSSDSISNALYLALKLVGNGAVAVFFGRKDSIPSFLRQAIDVIQKGVSFGSPALVSDPLEIEQLHALYVRHFGEKSDITRSAALGIFAHHGDTPHGIRLAIEHAMRDGLIRFVACTSTLAQGVNLPIRYLLVTSTRQGQVPMKVRDFQNLMGRVGRAGIHGEGTVIFTDTKPYDLRNESSDRWRWSEANRLLFPENSEPTGSSLLALIQPFSGAFGRHFSGISFEEMLLVEGNDLVRKYSAQLRVARLTAADFLFQLRSKLVGMNAIQSYLMSHGLEGEDDDAFVRRSVELVEETFAYNLASTVEREVLRDLFAAVARLIVADVPASVDRQRFGRSLLGVRDSLRVEQWLDQNLIRLLACNSDDEVGEVVLDLLFEMSSSRLFRTADPREEMREFVRAWLAGRPYVELRELLDDRGVRHAWGETQQRRFSLDDVVSLCEQSFAYELPLIVAAIRNSYAAKTEPTQIVIRVRGFIDLYQRRLKYGLPTSNATYFFEAGFADREVAQGIDEVVWGRATSVETARNLILEWEEQLRGTITGLPSYFRSVFAEIVWRRPDPT